MTGAAPVIFLRAFPFSLSILWRFVIALPALVLALIAFAIIAVALTAIASLLSPFIAIIVIIAFGVGASVVPVMVGMRVGLQSYHIKPRKSYLGMMPPAIGYGAFEALCMIVLLAICAGLFLALTPLTPNDLMGLGGVDQEEVLSQLISINPQLTWALIGCVALLAFALRAALLVPIAGASIGADPSGRPHTPFYGFGEGFLSVLALVLISQIGLAFVVPITLLILELAGIAETALAQIMLIATFDALADIATIGAEAWIFFGTTLFLSLFFFSLQCAGAVLVYLTIRLRIGVRQEARDEAMKAEEAQAVPMPDTDLRELLRSRMPEKKY